MDSIASPPTGAPADGPSYASITGSLAGSLTPLVYYAEDFDLEHNRLVCALVDLCHGLTHDDGMPAINVFTIHSALVDNEEICRSRFIEGLGYHDVRL